MDFMIHKEAKKKGLSNYKYLIASIYDIEKIPYMPSKHILTSENIVSLECHQI
jgi:hypothetical protein